MELKWKSLVRWYCYLQDSIKYTLNLLGVACGRAIRFKSSLRCGLFTAIPNAGDPLPINISTLHSKTAFLDPLVGQSTAILKTSVRHLQ